MSVRISYKTCDGNMNTEHVADWDRFREWVTEHAGEYTELAAWEMHAQDMRQGRM